jgi:hypothetical protein
MNGWNRPVVIPRQPGFLEQIAPQLLGIGAQLGLMKLQQNWQEKQREKTTEQQENRLALQGLMRGILRPSVEPRAPTLGYKAPPARDVITLGGKDYERAPLEIHPILGPNQKPLGGQYFTTGGGMDPQRITVPQGMLGPFKSIGEGDRYSYPKNTVYLVNPKTNEPHVLVKPEKPTKISTLEGLLVKQLQKEGASKEEIIATKNRLKTRDTTALETNIPLVARNLKISEEEATKILVQSKAKSDEQFWQDMYAKAITAYNTEEQSRVIADSALKAKVETFGAGKSGMKTLDARTAEKILKQAGGDKEKARRIAREQGYSF